MHPVCKEKEADLEYNGYLLWGLIAVELFMSFSFLGYIHIEPISITFVYIPVLVAACVLGPRGEGSRLCGRDIRTGIHVESICILCRRRRCSVLSGDERTSSGKYSAQRRHKDDIRTDRRTAVPDGKKKQPSADRDRDRHIHGKNHAYGACLRMYGDVFPGSRV